MGRAKEIVVKVIPAGVANEFVRRHHYSGKVVNNSTLHLGAFLDNRLHGVMSFGSPLDKRKVLPLVHTDKGVPCLWNEMLELNRMAFDDYLPRNSESRCISIAVRLLKKNAPHIRWILSFSDGTQCGDGTIYRASGFSLTGVKENSDCMITESGEVVHTMTVKSSERLMSEHGNWKKAMRAKFGNFKPLIGYQLRYILLIDKTCKIAAPIMPFSKIDEVGAGMYKGEKVSVQDRKQAQEA